MAPSLGYRLRNISSSCWLPQSHPLRLKRILPSPPTGTCLLGLGQAKQTSGGRGGYRMGGRATEDEHAVFWLGPSLPWLALPQIAPPHTHT